MEPLTEYELEVAEAKADQLQDMDDEAALFIRRLVAEVRQKRGVTKPVVVAAVGRARAGAWRNR
jgi:hypothetical protein